MKKKLLAILAAFVAVTPLTAVRAEDFDYSLGNEHNFIVNKEQEDKHANGDETVGIKMISLGDDPEDSGYVLGLITGSGTSHNLIYDHRDAYTTAPTKFTESESWKKIIEDYNGAIKDVVGANGVMIDYDVTITTPYVRNFNTTSKYLRVPTSKEVLDWFEYTKVNDNEYTLTSKGMQDFVKFYSYSLAMIKQSNILLSQLPSGSVFDNYDGYALGDDPEVTASDILTWVIVPTFTDGELTSVSVKKISTEASIAAHDVWVMVPILSFNKTYNCKFDTTKKTACFKCGDKYQWLVVGEQASTCVIDSSKTTKAKCTDNPPTGVEDYILEFAIAAGICGIVLFAIKRKSLFSRV